MRQLCILGERAQGLDREAPVTGAIGRDREAIEIGAVLRGVDGAVLDEPAIRADHVWPGPLAPRRFTEHRENVAPHVRGHGGIEPGMGALAVGQGGGGIIGLEPCGGRRGLTLDAFLIRPEPPRHLRERRERLCARARIAAFREQLGFERVGAAAGRRIGVLVFVFGERESLV